jgi:SAM-dependent methyltransferase
MAVRAIGGAAGPAEGVVMTVAGRASPIASPELVELWDGDRIREWQEYHLSGMANMISSANLCYSLLALADSGMLRQLRSCQSCSQEEMLVGRNADIGAGFLRYLSTCGVLEEYSGAYRLSRRGTMLTSDVALARLGFYLDAYGPVIRRAADLLDGSARYGVDVVRGHSALGRYSGAISAFAYTPVIRQVVNRRAASHLVDLGCGAGSLLVQLCAENPELTATGLDIAPDAIAAARELAIRQGVADRVRFAVADAFEPASWPADCGDADVICGIGVLHEKFRDGEANVIDLLNRFAQMLAGQRILLIGEPEIRYDNQENDSDFFLVHVLTLQGIPRDRQGWLEVIGQSRLRCRRMYVNAVAGPRTCFYELAPQE